MERIYTLKYGSVIFNAQTTNSARAREVFKTDHILKLEGCKKSTSRPGQSAEAVRASALQKKKKREKKPGRRHVATKSQRQKGKSITCSSRRGKRGRRRLARKPAEEVRAAGPLRCRGSAAPGETRRGGEGRTLRRRDRKTPLRQEASPDCPLTAATVREADPAGAPGSPARGGGRGGALTSPPLPRGLREGGRSAERGSNPPQFPAATPKLRGSAARTSPNKLGFSPALAHSPPFSLLKFFPPGR